jgi:hypothetical protein
MGPLAQTSRSNVTFVLRKDMSCDVRTDINLFIGLRTERECMQSRVVMTYGAPTALRPEDTRLRVDRNEELRVPLPVSNAQDVRSNPIHTSAPSRLPISSRIAERPAKESVGKYPNRRAVARKLHALCCALGP